MSTRPLSEGNRLQRAYARWAAPHYARMAPEMREQVELIDRFLYSKRGLGFWLGLAGALVGTTLGLRQSGMPPLAALGLATFIWVAVPISLLGAWLSPGKYNLTTLRRKLPVILILAMAGGLTGFVVGHVVRHGSLDWTRLFDVLWRGLGVLVPAVIGAAAAMLFLGWGVAQTRRQILERTVEREKLARERDTAARHAAEARLKLLQAQIQPHFIFNTLAALQHWVDVGDPRAPGLLRTLTAFLRGSTELLGRDTVTLGEECEAVGQYLQIMQARLGDRLCSEVHVDPACADRRLPPGLLLTLVENAIEHGIAPALDGGTVRVDVRCDAQGTTVTVRDDGAGLAPGWQDGTGLANCRERLRHHGSGHGTLTLQALDRGTEAVLHLPETA
ncbi:MAG: histidine kinase [Burkholderiaceae bacterium]|nr:histidine kinase [Burkholderiaceae bacterium]